jgi:hypothetical protein
MIPRFFSRNNAPSASKANPINIALFPLMSLKEAFFLAPARAFSENRKYYHDKLIIALLPKKEGSWRLNAMTLNNQPAIALI